MVEHKVPQTISDGHNLITKEHDGILETVEKSPGHSTPQEWSVQEALRNFSLDDPPNQPESPLDFFHMLTRLKTTKREGWRRFGIEHGESISDHMHRMSIITMLAPPSLQHQGLDIGKCAQMAVVHDMAEALVGDITPIDKIPKEEKSRRETTTMQYFTTKLLGATKNGMATAGENIMSLWQEYEDSKTLESKFVHDVDKLDLLLQMVEYEREHKQQKDLGEFCHVAKRIELAEVREWAAEVLEERKKFWGDKHSHTNGSEQVSEFLEVQKKQAFGFRRSVRLGVGSKDEACAGRMIEDLSAMIPK